MMLAIITSLVSNMIGLTSHPTKQSVYTSTLPNFAIVLEDGEVHKVYHPSLVIDYGGNTVAMWSRNNGAYSPGINQPAGEAGYLQNTLVPYQIVLDETGDIDYVNYRYVRYAHNPGAAYPSRPILGSERVAVYSHNSDLEIVNDASREQRALVVNITLDRTGLDVDTVAKVNAVIDRVRNRLAALLSAEADVPTTARLNAIVLFDEALTDQLGVTAASVIPTVYSTVRNNLQITYEDASAEDHFETAIHDALPVGASVRARILPLPGSDVDVSSIVIPMPIYAKWTGYVPEPILIRIKKSANWDYDAQNGIRTSAYDFEAVLQHELLHAMGFVSEADREKGPYNVMSILDLFRFTTANGPNITSGEMLDARRPILPVSGAIIITDTPGGSPNTTEMSSGTVAPGDGFQSSHWKNRSNSSIIGLMDPAQGTGKLGVIGSRYLAETDVRAIDLIGWDIPMADWKDLVYVPQDIQLASPGNGETDVSLTPTLTWTNPNTQSDLLLVSVYIREGVGDDAEEVFSAFGVDADSIEIPSDVLSGSTLYEWAVVGEGPYGGSEAGWRTFTTASACTADYNGDTEADILDFLDFIDDFALCENQPAPCGSVGDADFNGDTIVDILDFLDFLDALGTGC